jgi:predicted metal-dependent hydrolase
VGEPICRRQFQAEVRSWAERVGVAPRCVQVRRLKNLWASCSPEGRLSFDPDLLERRKEFRDAVIVHELLHLKVPNHGKLFKALSRMYLGDAAVVLRREAGSCRFA